MTELEVLKSIDDSLFLIMLILSSIFGATIFKR